MRLFLEITRGLPGSGKSRWATTAISDLVRMFGSPPATRVNRDDLRHEVFGQPVLSGDQEQVITKIQHDRIRSLLGAGINVIVDDTNLNTKRSVKPLQKIAQEFEADFRVRDFPISVDEAYENVQARVAAGGRDVPRHVIQGMYDRYKLKDGFPKITPLPDPPKFEPYVPDISKPPAWIFDVDGTLTTGPKDRGPYDFSKVHQDEGNAAVITLLRRLKESGDKIIVVSGRDDWCAQETLLWMLRNGISSHELHMRKTGDKRQDAIIKGEIFDEHIRDRFNVLGVVDDRLQVVRFWRSIGLTCFAVAEGDF